MHKPEKPALLERRALLALVTLSGFCGISYEILYARILGNLVGDQMLVSASILITFLLGIGLGTKVAHRFWRYLWAVEAGIGLCGLFFAFGGHWLEQWLVQGGELADGAVGGSLPVCCAVLLPPAFLIGCSLPLFAGYVSRIECGSAFARAYGLYNVGAAVTALLMEFVLIRWFGIRGTLLIIASLNGVVAVLLLRMFHSIGATGPESPTEQAADSSTQFFFCDRMALAVASISSAVFQLLMIKLSECLLGPFHETFALILAIVLLGLAVGAKVTERFRLGFGFIMTVNALSLIACLGGFDIISQTYASLYHTAAESYLASVALKFGTLFVLMIVPASTFGATIPALLNSLRGSTSNLSKQSGDLMCVSSIANAVGFLLMAFFLHRTFDYGVIVAICVTCAGVSVMLRHRLAIPASILQISLFGLAAFVHQTEWDEELLYVGHTSFHDEDELAESRRELVNNQRFKGHQDVFAINEIDGRPYFFINGYTSIPLTSPSERIVGAFSSVFAPDNERALVLGVGSGATANTVGQVFEHTDAVEINSAVLANLFRMKEYNFDIENNPSVSIIHDDAIHFTKQSSEQYSLIINTVTTPLYFSSSKLYTADFLQRIDQRLSPGGVYVTWVDSRVGDDGMDIILRTLNDSFDHCTLGCIKASYFLLLCSDEPISPRQPTIVADNPKLAHYFFAEHDLNPNWLHYAELTDRAFDLIGDPSGPLNTLDHPVLEFSMSRLRLRGIDGFKSRLLATLRPELPSWNSSSNPPAAVAQSAYERMMHLQELLGNSSITRRLREQFEERKKDDLERGFLGAERSWYLAATRIRDDADSHHRYGYRLLKLGRYKPAIEAFREALARDPQRNNSHFNIGSCLEHLGRLESARREYLLELTNDPDDEDVPYRVGRLSLRLGDFETAAVSLRKAIEISDDDENRAMYRSAIDGLERRSSFLNAAPGQEVPVQHVPRHEVPVQR